MPLVTPYKHIPQSERKFVGCYVDPKDVAYLESIFPMQTGLNDRVLCNLFRALIQHLKSIEPKNPNATDTTTIQSNVPGLSPTLPHEPAWYRGCPTYVLLDTLIANINFNNVDSICAERLAAGRTAGDGCSVTPTGGSDGVCPAVRPAAKQRTKPQGNASKRGRGKTRSEEKDSQEGQRGNGDGIPLAD